MKKVKIITVVIILLLALVVFLQNTQAVETKFLFFTVIMPRVLLLFMTFVLGFVGGIITASYVLRKPTKSQENC